MWNTFFDHAFNFFMAFDKLKRALTLFAIFLLVFSYLHHFKMHVKAHDKFLGALMASKLTTPVVSNEQEWLMLIEPP